MPIINLNKLKKRERLMISVLVLVIAVILYRNMIYTPLVQKKKKLIKTFKQIENTISEKQAVLPERQEIDLSQLDSIKSQYRHINKEYKTLEDKLLSKSESSRLIDKITKVAKADAVEIVYIKSEAPVKKEDFTALPVRISLIANYHDMLEYIKFLNSLSDFIKIEDIQIESQRDILPNINCVISLHVLLGKNGQGASLDYVIKQRKSYIKHTADVKKMKNPYLPAAGAYGTSVTDGESALTLTGILTAKGKKAALINGNLYNEGETVGDSKVLKIKRKYAILIDDKGRKYKLRIQKVSSGSKGK